MNPNEIREAVSAFQKSRIILTAFELDLFTFIGKESYSSETIAQSLNLKTNATERLLNALVSIQLLEKVKDNYGNTHDSFTALSKDSPAYMEGLMHSNHLWKTWSALTDVVKTGIPAQTTEINDRDENWLDAFIHAMHYRGKKQAPSQLSKIDLQTVNSVLDIGGGSGCYSIEFIHQKPDITTTLFDLPNVLPISSKIIDIEGYTNQVNLVSGDYTVDELPKNFDLVFLSAIIHSNSYQTNQQLIQKCYDSLNPNGRIIIQDWIMNTDKTHPTQGAIFSINMLVGVKK